MSNFAVRSTVNPDLWNLFIAIVSLGQTNQVRLVTEASTFFKKINFSKKIPFKCIRKQILTLTLSRSRSTYDHQLIKLGRPHILNATYQAPRLSALWFWRRRFFKEFYHLWAWRTFWPCDQNHLNKLLFPYPK